MGGEPTSSDSFEKLIEISQRYFYGIHIFTNAINDEIMKIHLRPHDSIIYNMNFKKTLNKEKLLLKEPGKRCLKIQLNKNSNIDEIISDINYYRSFDSIRIYPSFTFDCTYNIFRDKEELTQLLFSLEKRLNALHIHYGFDHKLPVCFLDNKNNISYPAGLCRVETSGLIDSSLNLRYCNQHHEKVCSLLNDAGNFIDWQIVKNSLLKYYYEQQLSILEGSCKNCAMFGTACNGGCWGHLLKENS